MRPHVSYRTPAAICLVCLWAMVCVCLNGFIPVVTAQESTTDSSALPTPTSAPTWTPTVTNTPNSHASPTAPSGTAATPTGRVVDFRADDRTIAAGECATFSWIVRGDFDQVEFNQHGDNKDAVLVPEEEYNAEECPDEDTEYSLIVAWLDGTQTEKTIKIKVDDSSGDDGGDGETNQTAASSGTGDFVPVTPLPISGASGGGGGQEATPQPVAYQAASDGAVVTPVGALSSVTLLPETGYGPPSVADGFQAPDGPSLAHLRWKPWLSFAARSGMFLSGIVVIGLILSIKLTH